VRKRLSTAVAVAASTVGVFSAIPAVASASTCHWKTEGNPLYVRSGPGTNYRIRGRISYGTGVSGNCRSANGKWYFILDPFDNTYHWANGDYLQPI